MLLQVLYHDQPPNVFFFPSLSGKRLEILFWDNSDLKFKKGKAEVLLRYQIAHCFSKKNSHFKYLCVRNKIIMQFLLTIIIMRLLHRFFDWMQCEINTVQKNEPFCKQKPQALITQLSFVQTSAKTT